jgi:hypothetical protein
MFRLVAAEHKLNIFEISFTFLVSNESISNFVKDFTDLNILDIFVTSAVLKLDILKSFNDLQNLNIPDM